MSKVMAWCAGVVLAGAVAVGGSPATAAWRGGDTGARGKATGGPGLASPDTVRDASVNAVSCPSAGNCAAGGYDSVLQGFVVSERNGRWGKATAVPGLRALNTSGDASVNAVSCPSAGNCAAGGYYSVKKLNERGFVAVERNGRWDKATAVPGLEALDTGGFDDVDSVSCGSAGNCVAGGFYFIAPLGQRGFVAVERNGRWGKATAVPGLAALDTDKYSGAVSVSCGPQGYCAVGGFYLHHGDQGAFVASERNGRWANATAVPGLGALNTSGDASVTTVSCPSAGNCAAGGDYLGGGLRAQGFVVSERNGHWGKAIEVPGLGALNTGAGGTNGVDELSVSCGSAGSCVVGGDYRERGGNQQGFVAVERNGRWAKAIEVPGLGALNTGGLADVYSVSCASPGTCAVGGDYSLNQLSEHGFVAVERNGRWAKAIEVPGLAALDTDRYSAVASVSCGPAGYCAVAGWYSHAGDEDAFVASERNGRWAKAIEVSGLGA